MRSLLFIIAAAAAVPVAQGQIIITAEDMFNKVGQYYKAYSNAKDHVLTGELGKAGTNEFWNFTKGPTDEILRFDYVTVDKGSIGKDFPKAKFVERKTEQGDGSQAWLFLEQAPGRGRIVYGFYEPKFPSILGASNPSHLLDPPIVDFPETIRYGDAWDSSTSYRSDIVLLDTAPDPDDPEAGGGSFGIPIRIARNSSAKADAYGIINLPGIGFGDALRVNELVEQVTEADLFGEGSFETVSTDYIRNFYWLRKDYGVVAQITSRQQSAPPSDTFSTAAAFIRMFETNHGKSIVTVTPPPEGITGFTITMGRGQVLLNWDTHPRATSYKVEHTPDPGRPEAWITLQTTQSNHLLDTTVPGAAVRFYRITGIP
jgi:hypothetical protein